MNRRSTRTVPRKKAAAATEPGELLASDAALQVWCAAAPPGQPVALDTEFVGERTYYPRLELLQIKAGDRIALVDVPACRDWTHLAAWLADGDRLKILHAAESDLPLLFRLTGIWAAPVFDTQLAAAFLGHGAQISLTNLIKSQVRVDVGSHQTTSDWSQRPLSAAQLDYAADDVRYLPRLQAQLEEALRRANRWAWYEEEQRARLAQMMAQEEDPLDVMYKRVRGWQALKPRDLAVLRELAAWREGVSRTKDLPRRRLVSDEGLIELARHQPESRQAALGLRRVYPNQITR
ncbi:MAG: HRDC domain-containing protein [Candidatus Marinimicrobia bacterium]|nr:HRDC domain-containing protein [Candidatus Neomarinimicrobiota bacterium]